MDPVVAVAVVGGITSLSVAVAKLAAPAVKTVCAILETGTMPVAREIGEATARRIKKYSERKLQLIADAPHSFEARAELGQLLKIESQQRNLENVVQQAILLLEEIKVDGTPPSEQWNDVFRDGAREASDEDLRRVWANLLATEYSSQGAVSVRSLRVIKNLMREDAEFFSKYLSVAIGGEYLVCGSDSSQPYSYAELHVYDTVKMMDAGLIVPKSLVLTFLELIPTSDGPAWGQTLYFPKHTFDVYVNTSERPSHVLHVNSFTEVGKTLARALGIEENTPAVKALLKMLKSQGFKISLLKEDEGQQQVAIENMTDEQIDAM